MPPPRDVISNPRWIVLVLALSAVPFLGAPGLVILGVLALVAADARVPIPVRDPALWLELTVVAGLCGLVLVQSCRGEVWDEPLGQDANRYLKNAWAIGIGAWPLYHPWRGPLHALLTLALPWGLIPASKLLSIGATVATIPATWWLGRGLLGALPGLIGAFLLAFWPDLWWTARFSTPYPLLTLLVVVAVGCASYTARHPAWGVGVGVAFALAIATDLRAQGIAAAVAVAGAAAMFRPESRRWGAVLLGSVVAATVASRGLLALFPVPLEPLSQQVQEHSRLLSGIVECRAVAGQAVPTDFFGPCGRHLLIDNLSRSQRLAMVSLPLLALFAALGVVRHTGLGAPRLGLVLLPILGLAPAFLMTHVEHRYLMPLLPLGFVLVGAGVAGLGEMSRRPFGLLVAPVLAAAWALSPTTIWARAKDPVPGRHPFVVSLGVARPMTLAARALAGAPLADRIVDCATADLQIRLYPRPVQTIGNAKRLSARCARLLAEGPDSDGQTWVLIRAAAADARWAGWQTVWTGEATGDLASRDLVVVRGTH